MAPRRHQEIFQGAEAAHLEGLKVSESYGKDRDRFIQLLQDLMLGGLLHHVERKEKSKGARCGSGYSSIFIII